MSNIIVMKFGGSSVANASAMLNVYQIISSQKCKKLVVLSACKGVTDLLIEAANLSLQSLAKSIEIINIISEHHKQIIENAIKTELRWNAMDEIGKLIRQIREYSEGIFLLQELTPKMLDYYVSFGEKLSTTVFYYILLENKINAALINSENYIITNSKFGEAEPNYPIIQSKVQKELKPQFDAHDTIIAQGFIGSDLECRTTTLGRGGSDFSASIYGLALDAKEIQIWTDVSGIKSADPRLVEQAITLDEMTIDEIRELSFYGAKVLHPDTIKPAIEAGIPIKVLNTFSPLEQGTIIKENNQASEPKLHSISVLNEVTKLHFHLDAKRNNNLQIVDILNYLIRRNIKILSSSQSETSFVLFAKLENQQINNIIATYTDFQVEAIKGDLICLVGNNILLDKELLAKLIKKIESYQIDYIQFGINKQLSLLFSKENTREIIERIHSVIGN